MSIDGVRAAIKAAGGMRALARALRINYQSIQSWQRIPAERVVDVEQITGIPREKLRPDIFRKK
jgi:DNA-binding transcriptional regulator YdaS (Cro superfamily)